jgi:segregation and condensation protein A
VNEGRAGSDPISELDAASPALAFRIALPNFEGPLDLLLHLIKEHKLDIFDIPIALITEKYLEHLEKMREINLDIAGEFLVMAATLAHLKSRLLLPRPEAQTVEAEPEDKGDPRAELVRRLLEYQKYKDAAETLGKQDILDRDVFPRRVEPDPDQIPSEDVGLAEVSVYKLIEALGRVLKNAAPQLQHEVVRERVSLNVAIRSIADKLKAAPKVTFIELFEGQRHRQQIVITFLAMLEMCKLKLIRIFQESELGEILITPNGEKLAELAMPEVDELEYK